MSHISAGPTQPRDMPAMAPMIVPTIDRDHHGGEADRERDASAVEHAGEQVLPEIVGAERMRPRRRLQARGEIDVVDRDAARRTAPNRIATIIMPAG